MKLLFDCSELSYFNDKNGHRAGVFYVALNLLKEFQKKGVDITFYCDYRRHYFMKEIECFKDIPLLEEHSFMNKLIGSIHYFTRNLPHAYKQGFVVLARFYDKYLSRPNKKNLEQLNEFDVYFSPFTPPTKDIESANFKRFRMLHDIIPILEKGMPKNTKDWHYKVYNTISENEFYVTNSDCTRFDVLQYFPFIKEENIKTTYLGADVSFTPQNVDVREKYGIPKDKKYVYSLCTIGKRKNIIFAIKNFIKFIEQNGVNDLVLVLGGSNWISFRKELDAIFKDVDKSKILLIGYVDDKDLPSLYSNALMFIYPSLYEGFGLPVLEAMQCGCPVITSNRSSLPEVIGNAGIQIDPENDEEMVKALEKMYSEIFFRELCQERGLIRAKNFSWEKCASEILEYISEKTSECG